MRFLVADDEAKVRSAIVLLLQHQPNIASIEEADSTAMTDRLLKKYAFDVVLLDWELPKEGGENMLVALRAVQPDVLVIVLSSHPEVRREALASGADVFVSKGEPPDVLLAAIRIKRALVGKVKRLGSCRLPQPGAF